MVKAEKFLAWQLYLHYIFLTILLFPGFYLGEFVFGFEAFQTIPAMFVWFLVWIFMTDSLIHMVLSILTGWED